MSRFVGVSKLITTATRNKTCLLSNQKLATCYVGFSSKRLASTNQVPTELAPTEVANKVTEVVDPPFVELGLADGWMPYSFVESLFETLHTYTGLPWWATIAIGTLTMRAVTFPIFVNSRKYATRMSNHGAKTSELQQAMQEANMAGHFTEKAQAGRAYFTHIKETKTAPWHMYPMFVMGGTFTSCFFALRNMANVPLPTLEASNFLWLDSLCACDPYRVLPLTTGAVVGMGVYMGMKFGSSIPAQYAQYTKYVPVVPMVFFPLVMGSVSGAVQIYMIVNSSITSGLCVLMLNPKVQEILNMPKRIPQQQLVPETTTTKSGDSPKKGFFATQLEQGKIKARRKTEVKMIRRMVKQEEKRRRKELRQGEPPKTYEIGTEAVLTSTVADFDQDQSTAPRYHGNQVINHEPEKVKTRTVKF